MQLTLQAQEDRERPLVGGCDAVEGGRQREHAHHHLARIEPARPRWRRLLRMPQPHSHLAAHKQTTHKQTTHKQKAAHTRPPLKSRQPHGQTSESRSLRMPSSSQTWRHTHVDKEPSPRLKRTGWLSRDTPVQLASGENKSAAQDPESETEEMSMELLQAAPGCPVAYQRRPAWWSPPTPVPASDPAPLQCMHPCPCCRTPGHDSLVAILVISPLARRARSSAAGPLTSLDPYNMWV